MATDIPPIMKLLRSWQWREVFNFFVERQREIRSKKKMIYEYYHFDHIDEYMPLPIGLALKSMAVPRACCKISLIEPTHR